MLKIVKKPQPLSSLSTIFIRLQNGNNKKIKIKIKKSLLPPPFGDVVIHKTGTRLTKGGGEGVMGTTARTRQRSTGKGSVEEEKV